jgi:HD-GYP domain-containing protein (c-di-GMP phosphodiesterase class II)
VSDSTRETQELLRRTLSRAQAEENRELAKTVREQGMAAATVLNGLLHLARIHAPNNSAFDGPVAEFASRLRSLLDLVGPVHLLCVEDQVYVNDVRVRFDALVEQAFTLGSDLLRHEIGGATFNLPLADHDVRHLLHTLMLPAAPTRPRAAVQHHLDAAGLSSVELHPILQYRVAGDEAIPVNEEYRDLYRASAGVVAEAFAALGADRLPNPLPSRRAVVQLLDAARGVDAVAAARDADASLPAISRHTLMVTNLALLIGRQVRLPNASLADLGVAAIFHDVGFSLGDEGFTVPFERHARAGLKVLLRQRGFYQAKIRRLLTVAQHHGRHDRPEGPPSLYARIVHIADDFDILTRYRPGRGPVHAVPDAMGRMAAGAGTLYDPVLFQAFANAMGPFPPGSLLQLADGHVVVSVSAVRSPETFSAPLCRVVRAPDGSRPANQPFLELAGAAKVAGILRPAG